MTHYDSIHSVPPASYPPPEPTTTPAQPSWSRASPLDAAWTATFNQLVSDRQRLLNEVEVARHHAQVQAKAAADHCAHIAQLSSQNGTLQASLHAILRLRHLVDGDKTTDEADAEDEEESMLELLELRRWKREFSVQQTRSLIDRLEELTAENRRLREIVSVSCSCKQAQT